MKNKMKKIYGWKSFPLPLSLLLLTSQTNCCFFLVEGKMEKNESWHFGGWADSPGRIGQCTTELMRVMVAHFFFFFLIPHVPSIALDDFEIWMPFSRINSKRRKITLSFWFSIDYNSLYVKPITNAVHL